MRTHSRIVQRPQFEVRRRTAFTLPFLAAVLSAAAAARSAETDPARDPFRADNLVAWCIVPFDASNRGPAERAAMLKELGIGRVAYDWRDVHVATFEEEILEYKKRGLEYFAFWEWHDAFAPLVKQHGIHPQFWFMIPQPPNEGTQEEKVDFAVKGLATMVERTAQLDCQLGLYNHGGWAGEPANLVAVCERLRQQGGKHVGIVYNLHHGHNHIHDFERVFALMKPYLLCLNLNGMNDDARPKILPLGKGAHEERLLRIIQESGYDGPIGIIDHRSDLDTKQSLAENLEGLARLRKQLAAESRSDR